MPLYSEYKTDATRNVLLAGYAKGSGKSTTAISGPGNKILLQYDIGSPTLPPGVDANSVFVRIYPPADVDLNADSDGWKRAKNVGREIIQDVMAIHNGVLARKHIVLGGEEVPWIMTPNDTLILDGGVQFLQYILDWILAVNNKRNPEDFENRHAPWGKRLNQANIIYNMLLPLPVNVVLTTWVQNERETRLVGSGRTMEVESGRILPDLGGKMSVWGPGKVDAAIYLYSERTREGLKFMAKVKPDEKFPWVGMRGNYSDVATVDLTISNRNPTLPWDRLFPKQ